MAKNIYTSKIVVVVVVFIVVVVNVVVVVVVGTDDVAVSTSLLVVVSVSFVSSVVLPVGVNTQLTDTLNIRTIVKSQLALFNMIGPMKCHQT